MARKIALVQTYTQEVKVNTGVQNIAIPDIAYLRNKIVTGIEAYCFEQTPNFPGANAPVATAAQLRNIFLQLYVADPSDKASTGLFVNNISLLDLSNIQATGAPFVQERLEFNNVRIQWDKCNFIFATAPNNEDPFTIALNIYYSTTDAPGAIGGLEDNAVIGWLLAKVNALEQIIRKMVGNG